MAAMARSSKHHFLEVQAMPSNQGPQIQTNQTPIEVYQSLRPSIPRDVEMVQESTVPKVGS
jgi:hypothetical protein